MFQIKSTQVEPVSETVSRTVSRRQLLRSTAKHLSLLGLTGFGLPVLGTSWTGSKSFFPGILYGQEPSKVSVFKLSLNERSIASSIQSGLIDHLDFTRIAREELDIRAVDYVTSLFQEEIRNESYITEMNRRAAEFGVRHVLLIVENEGALGSQDTTERNQALKNHLEMIDIAQALGCRGICVQPLGEGDSSEVDKRLVGSLTSICEIAQTRKINVMIANRGNPKMSPNRLLGIVESVDHSGCGAFTYFDGFLDADRMDGLRKMIPFSKGLSAVLCQPDEPKGDEEKKFRKMMGIVRESEYPGYLSLEFNGQQEGWTGIRSMIEIVREFQVSVE